MYWAEHGLADAAVLPDPELTRFCLCLYVAPLPQPTGVKITRSPYAKPLAVTMPIDAKVVIRPDPEQCAGADRGAGARI